MRLGKHGAWSVVCWLIWHGNIFAADDLRVSFSAPKTNYAVCEPVSLTICWSNASSKPFGYQCRVFEGRIRFYAGAGSTTNVVMEYDYTKFYLSKDGGPKRLFKCTADMRRATDPAKEKAILYHRFKLPPGGRFALTEFAILGSFTHGEDFLLASPGTYALYPTGSNSEPVQISVTAPADDERDALKHWKEETCGQFVLGREGHLPPLDKLKAFKRQYPLSLYAPYATLGIARQIVSQPNLMFINVMSDPDADGSRLPLLAMLELRTLLKGGTTDPAVLEHAFFLNGLYFANSQKERQQCADQIGKIHPQSGLIDSLRRYDAPPEETLNQ
jgi:hypothetical protein